MVVQEKLIEKQFIKKTKVPRARYPFWIAQNINLEKRKPVQWWFKRFIDIFISITGLIMISPVLAIVAIAIKLESKGPICFKQKRVGLYGRKFNMYKFRSMVEDAEDQLKHLIKYNESDDITTFKLTNDPRITRAGKFIRKTSLDEVPQLINVIKGEMSLIGPRPLPNRDNSFDNYKDWYYLRYATLPGITGLWQVSGRSDLKELDTIVNLDYKYIKNWSLWLDIKILIKTIPVVLFSKGAV